MYKIKGILIKNKNNDYSYWEGFSLTEEEEKIIWNVLNNHSTEGGSIRGTKAEVIEEMKMYECNTNRNRNRNSSKSTRSTRKSTVVTNTAKINNKTSKRTKVDSNIPNISGFVDFCSYHSQGYPIYFVNGHLYAGFDMLASIEYRYNFVLKNSQKEIEKAIMENMYMFDVTETDKFFYPNDNMFSGDNSIRNIRGQVLVLKKKYR